MFFKKKKSITQLSKEVAAEEKRWEKEKDLLSRHMTVQNEKNEMKQANKKKISTSKLLVCFLFVNCSIIEFFTMYVIIKMLNIATFTGMGMDFSPLVALIGTVVTETIGYSIYSLKSTKENTKGGIVYETTMRQVDNDEAQG